MLVSLSISNFALIEKLAIDFSDGFSIITGETGAGKSILLGALGLVLGKRADLGSLKNKDEKCIIEAHFQISDYNLKDFFEENDIDYDDNTIIRREILPTGKSRAFVNDSPINLQNLLVLGEILIDIHSQQQTQELSDEHFQFQIIDSIAQNKDVLNQYAQLLKQYKANKALLNTLQLQLHSVLKEQDYNSFLLDELIAANLKTDELQDLELLYEQLNNVEAIKLNFEKALILANNEQFGIQPNLLELKNSLQKAASYSKTYLNLSERIVSLSIEFDDIINELNNYSENLSHDPIQLEHINNRLQVIYNLFKKHQVDSIDNLLLIQNDLDSKVVSVVNLENEINSITQSIQNDALTLDELSYQINQNRNRVIPILTNQLLAILENLGMPNARFDIKIKSSDTYHANGKDELEFLFSANKGADFGLLKKVASGGEMSRIMLAVKAVLAQYSKLPTIIFDEIDTGVSGDIANKMGDIMKQMSLNMQVFAITHLPQIAAKGNVHFKVFKHIVGEQTISELKLLNQEERIIEIAQMLSGSEVSDSAINHAKALLN